MKDSENDDVQNELNEQNKEVDNSISIETITVQNDKMESNVEQPVIDETVRPTEEKTTNSLNKMNSNDNNKDNKVIVILLLIALVLVISTIVDKVKQYNKKEKIENDNTEVINEVNYKLSDYKIDGTGIENFDLYFLKENNDLKNKIYSPISIKYALQMLSEGSDGNTKQQFDEVIGNYKSNSYSNSQNLSFANALFVRNTFKDNIVETYIEKIKDKYNADIVYDDFMTANNLNNYISRKTLNLINGLLDDSKVRNVDFAVVNALAIDMEWKNKIQCVDDFENKNYCHNQLYYLHEKGSEESTLGYYVLSLNESGYINLKFNNIEAQSLEIGTIANRYDIVNTLGESNIRKTVGEEYKKWLEEDVCEIADQSPDVNTYLDTYIGEINKNYEKYDTSTDFYYSVNDEVKVFAKDLKTYDGVSLQYVGIMPIKVNLKNYVNSLDKDKLTNIVNNLKDADKLTDYEDGYITKITGYIPTFKFDYELLLTDNLKKLGLVDVFDSSKANLSNMTNSKTAYIKDTLHKATIEFSNDGIKASSVTVGGGKGSTGCMFDYLYEVPIKNIDLTFDKPYMFIIRDKSNGEIWFIGTTYKPDKYKKLSY